MFCFRVILKLWQVAFTVWSHWWSRDYSITEPSHQSNSATRNWILCSISGGGFIPTHSSTAGGCEPQRSNTKVWVTLVQGKQAIWVAALWSVKLAESPFAAFFINAASETLHVGWSIFPTHLCCVASHPYGSCTLSTVHVLQWKHVNPALYVLPSVVRQPMHTHFTNQTGNRYLNKMWALNPIFSCACVECNNENYSTHT